MPPVPPTPGAAVERSDLVLTAADGNEFAAFEAMAADRGGAVVIVLPDVRGLFRFYEELAVRFAEAGHDSIAIDYFGRTAGVGKRPGEWDFRPHVEQVTHEGLRADVAAAIDRIVARTGDRPLFTVGFCFGGSNSWHQAANGLGLAGAIGFYGRPTTPDRPRGAASVVDRLGDVECPILALMGGDDPSIPPETVAEFERALGAAGVEHGVVTYQGAPHSFFDRSYEEHAEASADAWRRVLDFIDRHR
jgi:carboxymethylenebutenolidase